MHPLEMGTQGNSSTEAEIEENQDEAHFHYWPTNGHQVIPTAIDHINYSHSSNDDPR